MISVVVSKWVADALENREDVNRNSSNTSTAGIYGVWIAMRAYPWLPPTAAEFRDQGQTAETVLKCGEDLVVIEDDGASGKGEVLTLGRLDELINTWKFYGFPVVQSDGKLVGYVTRNQIRAYISQSLSLLH